MPAMTDNKPFPPTLSELSEEEELPLELPDWIQTVACPRCFKPMTALWSKRDARNSWGESIQYQCHNALDGGTKLCLIVMNMTTSVPFYLRPGDFSASQFDWKIIAPQTIPAKKVKATPADVFKGVPRTPPSPWKREVVSKVLWDLFWDNYERGMTPDELTNKLIAIKGDTAKNRALVKTLPKLVGDHAGYAVVVRDGIYRIIGKAKGNESLQPYGDRMYRKVHGFPL